MTPHELFKKIQGDLLVMNVDDAREFYDVILQFYKQKRALDNAVKSQNFSIGDKVRVSSGKNGKWEGVVERVNRTTLIIKKDKFLTYRVSIGLCNVL